MGVNLDFRRAPTFLGLFSALVVLGAVVALIPNVPLIQMLTSLRSAHHIDLGILNRVSGGTEQLKKLGNEMDKKVRGCVWATLVRVRVAGEDVSVAALFDTTIFAESLTVDVDVVPMT